MRITVVGAGYVGLVAGTCLAETGHEVTVVEVDAARIATLRQGQVPFYEPGLADLLARNINKGRLRFTGDIAEAVPGAACAFIAVGTPQDEDGSADLQYVLRAAEDIGRAMTGPLVVVIKSTVPVGTHRLVAEKLAACSQHAAPVVSNPEFLKEGAAVDDFMRPDRVVVGTGDEQARELMADIYAPFVRTGNPILFMDNYSAEMAKYAANGLLATRISFMNEIALLCDAVGADVDQVRLVLGSDRRIGPSFLFPGMGFGGSCFPKDVRALARSGAEHGVDMYILEAVDRVNARQKEVVARRVQQRFGEDLAGRTFAVWGLAFKPRTDDMRDAPSVKLIQRLQQAGAAVAGHDPQAHKTAREVLGDTITYHDNVYEPLADADGLIICTEWMEFRSPDFKRIGEMLKHPVIFDGRNLYEPDYVNDAGLDYICVGRPDAIR